MYRIINSIKISSLIISAILFSACSSTGTIRLYDGEQKNENEIVTFNLPEAVDLLEVDGKKVKLNIFLSENQYQLQVLPGKHLLKARYSDFWGSQQYGLMVASDDFYFVVDGKAGDQFTFMHNAPEDLSTADDRSSVDDVTIWLVDQKTGLRIDSTSYQGYGGFIQNLLTGSEEVKKADDTATQPIVETQLRYWWKLADQKQRESFLLWLNSQD